MSSAVPHRTPSPVGDHSDRSRPDQAGAASDTTRTAGTPMRLTGMLIGLVAWVAFTLILRLVGPDHVAWAAAAALAIGVVSLVVNARGGVKILDVASVASFAVLTVLSVLGGPAVDNIVADYGRGGCALVVGLVMAVSAVTVPFTEQYARASVSRASWNSPVFRAVNRKISLIWATIILLMSAGHFLDGYLDGVTQGPTRLAIDTLCNWVVPVAATYLGIRLTKAIIAARRSPATAPSSTP